ncbi:MAG: 3-hydroxy-2-methylbutyryl-CoA dehydrogenase [Gammaproteobacteria bacterium RIFCSPHIGHO2_12_FULL_45_9]|nr:MAG: 3-hydroxy-2-methylbutyryl-CoA dehydrogenase [Gammaproteobacteria bacterium RIFCSPHIGHO2_12_FULL_45_9]
MATRTVLITGGASGLGESTAKYLFDNGFKVAIVDQDADRGKVVAAAVQGLAFQADVADEASIQTAIDSMVSEWGQLSVCINCAGIAPAARLVGRSGPHALALFEKVIRVNLVGTFNVMRLAAAQMIKQAPYSEDGERGLIINTASIAALEGQIGQVAYSASKGAVAAMTLPAARELASQGIRVMTIAPGVIATPMMSGLPSEVQTALGQAVPFPKRLGLPEEFAQVVRMIIETPYLNGSLIRLDGALRMAAQ